MFQSKESDAALVVFEDDSFDEARLEELASGGQGLFAPRFIALFRRVFENGEAKEAILARLCDLETSPHFFIFSEKKLDAATIAAFKKKTNVEIKEFRMKSAVAGEKSFASFALADALGKRDKKRAWAVFHRELAKGSSVESLHGMLFWQIKNMLLASKCPQAECARIGMKPFVFDKARAAAKNFSKKELLGLSSSLVALYHRAHEGNHELETAVEHLILNT